MSNTHLHIHILPPALRDQIAAGEVVERPASVVKELMENSLDAGARRIDVEITGGGTACIRVRDDGAGVPENELKLAVTRHATSKIVGLEDLVRIASFGFRGEALPSIASVSRLKMTSRPADAEYAAFVTVESGQVSAFGPAGAPPGSEVEVRDLFADTPARLKFLKTPGTEVRRCQETLQRISLAHLEVAFALTSDSREIFRLPAGQSLADRLAAFWPPSVCEGLTPFNRESGGIRASGLAGNPATAQGRGDRILLWVNGRPVQDRLLLSAVREAYRGRLLTREHPQIALFLQCPLEQVDVNVHPAKLEVRFSDERAVFALVRSALLSALERITPIAGGLGHPGREAGGPGGPKSWITNQEQPAPRTGEGATAGRGYAPPPLRPMDAKFSSYRELLLEYGPGPISGNPPHDAFRPTVPTESPAEFAPQAPPTQKAPGVSATKALTPGLDYLGQVADTYLILRDGRGLMLIDQHAAHERVLFDLFRRERGKGNAQPLAIPLTFSLHPAQAERLEELREPLHAAGFRLTPSDGILTVAAIPPTLDAGRAKAYLLAALDGQVDGLDGLWTLLACKAAVKANQPLAMDEALALLSVWLDCPDRDHCPHGRPTAIRFSPGDLEKLFKRS